ncbi:hypothetical protein BX070DRAFT_224763 [Coemansia spiralis]|nr:hypothetical protein BX070DRAFT_224763 [Coemansia spiralis]
MSKLGDGRTSDLIKRFESLALDTKSGPPIRMPKPATKLSSVVPATATATAGAESAWKKLPSDSQPPASTAPAAPNATETAETSAPAVSAKPATSTSSTQDLMTISAYSYAQNPGSPKQPERMQSLLPGRSRANTTDSVVRNTFVQSKSSPDTLSAMRRRSLVTALNQRANIDPAIQASSKSWLTSAERRIDEARLDLESGDLENAYLRFMIACNIVSEKLPKQKDFEFVRKDPKYVKLHKDIATHVLDELEKLSTELKKRPYVEPVQRIVLTPDQVDKMEAQFTHMYPENPLDTSIVDSSAQPSALRPMKRSGSEDGAVSSSVSSTSDNRWLAARQNKFDEIDAQANRIDASAQSSRAQGIMLPGVSIVNRSQSSNRVAMAISPPLGAIGEDTENARAGMEYFDPNATTCTPQELWNLLDRSRTGVNGRPMVLILDVRPHQDFIWGRINHRYVVNIDPIGLDKHKCTSAEITSSLVLVSEEQQEWFRRRDEFDVVVYVSQSTRSFSEANSKELLALEAVNRAIYHYEFEKPLKRPPLFLIGGFDAWSRVMSSEQCLWSEEARRSQVLPETQVASSPKIQQYHSVNTGTTLSASSAPNSSSAPQYQPSYVVAAKQNYTGNSDNNGATQPVVAGSVYDFFQQNNTYHPQWQQHDGRHAPTHSSYTQGYNARMTPRVSVPEPSATQHVAPPAVQPTVSNGPITTAPVFSGPPMNTSGYENNSLALHAAKEAAVPPVLPPKPASLAAKAGASVQRRKTIFDNPTYGFTGPAYVSNGYGQDTNVHLDPSWQQQQHSVESAELQRKRRDPPPVPLPHIPQMIPKPAEYYLPHQQQDTVPPSRVSKAVVPSQPTPPSHPPSAQLPPKPQAYIQQQMQQQQLIQQQQLMQQQQMQQQFGQQRPMSNGYGFYSQPVAAGSDPSLNGRMHAGNNLRNSALYSTDILPPDDQMLTTPMSGNMPSTPISANAEATSTQLRRRSQLSDTAAYGATGLKNFGNTCFMNCVVQCLVGTAPFARYFLQGGWKKDMLQDKSGKMEVTVEFARLVDNMWRGQYGSLSPIGFRAAVAKCSEVFKGNDQEDAHEFASFLLDTLHESLNRVRPRPPADKELSPEEEMHFEALPDIQQANIQWGRYIRRNWSIMTSIFQGQAQSRLTCLTCKHTSTTYHTFTELSVPIPNPSAVNNNSGKTLVRKSMASSNGRNMGPVNIYQCLDAYSEVEVLDGDDKWMCPKCNAKRKATKRLLISRLPLVLIVHLKRFSTIGHFREKLETNVLVPTRNLYLDRYAIPDARQMSNSTSYNLYGVANHFGTLSGGHYTASVFNGLRGQWNYFDDTRVSIIPENNVTTPAAYLLFFVQSQQ